MTAVGKLLDILICPQCKGKLAQVEGGQGLLCKHCQLKFPVRDGIPVMLVEEAFDMRTGAQGQSRLPPQAIPKAAPAPAAAATAPVAVKPSAPVGGTQIFSHKVGFRVVSGPDEGMKFDLSRGACRALGRALADTSKTTVISVDWAISLDDETKGLIFQYIAQQFRKPIRTEDQQKKDQVGSFKREADVIFKDTTLSRLHGMIFFDEIGIGILDLVSKNGTFVNGEEIESRLLKKGDTIEMGESKFIFEG